MRVTSPTFRHFDGRRLHFDPHGVDGRQIPSDVGTPLTHGHTNVTETSTISGESLQTVNWPFDKSKSGLGLWLQLRRASLSVQSLLPTRSGRRPFVGVRASGRAQGSLKRSRRILFPGTVPQNKWANSHSLVVASCHVAGPWVGEVYCSAVWREDNFWNSRKNLLTSPIISISHNLIFPHFG